MMAILEKTKLSNICILVFLNSALLVLRKQTNQSTFIELINIGRFKHGLHFQIQTRRIITCGPCILYFKYNILSSFEFGNKVSVTSSLFNRVSFSCLFLCDILRNLMFCSMKSDYEKPKLWKANFINCILCNNFILTYI